jgi:hypothetical protein
MNVDDITDRIERLKKQAAALSGGRMVSRVSPDLPPEVEDEGDRRRWADDYPDDLLPEPKPLPYDRDRHLPSQWASPPADVDDDVRMS